MREGTITATGQTQIGQAADGMTGFWVIQFEGVTTETIKLQGSLDGTNFYDIAFLSVGATDPSTLITSHSDDGIYRFDASGFVKVQIDVAAFAGTITYTARPVRG